MNKQTYLFVDGGHLRSNYAQTARRWFGTEGAIDFQHLKNAFSATKCFYYDDILGDAERREDFEARVGHK